MSEINNTKKLKREILVRLIKAFFTDDFQENTRRIPYDMRPKGYVVPYRCCIYKERAILRDRILASLGLAIEGADDSKSLAFYAGEILQRPIPDSDPLTILETACKGCNPNRIYVTDLCQGCVARPCVSVCRFQAVAVINGKSIIDQEKCKNCGMCVKVCPYQAIAKVIIPCENSCPVDAIRKNHLGYAKINAEKCISCGKCINACPFGAIHEKSHIIDVLKHIKSGAKVIAMVAPSIFLQFSCQTGQLHSAIKKIGFHRVYEVAQGADITIKHEAEEFGERYKAGQPFMTTSCCASYNELVKKHLPELKPYCSTAKTPLSYTAEIAREENKDAFFVFISPCVAKRCEIAANPNIDYLLNAEELEALFIALDIDVAGCSNEAFFCTPSKQGRGFAVTGGVSSAVKDAYKNDPSHIKPAIINCVNKQVIKDLKHCVQNNACLQGNLIEVMVCEGGCVGGNATINHAKKARAAMANYADEGEDMKGNK